VPIPWRVSTSRAACNFDKASRTTVRLTLKRCTISASVASLSPARSLPASISFLSASTSSAVRLRRTTGTVEAGGSTG
jgi:hypothetical protein